MNRYFICNTLVFLLCALLQACGGGGGGSSSSGTSVFGVAATGLAINGSVTLKDSAGATRTAAISQPDGTFSIDVAGLAPPYFLMAADNAGTTTLYSLATGTGNFNINPLSNLVVAAAAMNMDTAARDPAEVFRNPARFVGLTPSHIRAATESVLSQMSPGFKAALTVNGAGNINPLTGSFQIGKGLDKVFDDYAITLDTATGEVRERRAANNTVTALGLVDKLGTFPAAGIYDGTVDTPSGSRPVTDVVITPSGEMRYVTDNGVQLVATLTASGSGVTGTGKAYDPALNGQPANLTLTGTLSAGTLSGTLAYGSLSDTFRFSRNAPQTGISSSLERIAGTYASSTDSSSVFIGHIEADGRVWGSGSGIAYSGLIQVMSPNTNIYRVTLAYRQNGTYGQVSGLATFHEAAPLSALFSLDTALVPIDYAGDIAGLTYSRSVSGNQGMLTMLLAGPLQRISLFAARMSAQQQAIAARQASGQLMVQATSNSNWSATATNIQFSESAATITITGQVFNNPSGTTITLLDNPGNIALNGPGQVAIPLPPSIASSLPVPSGLPALQSQPGAEVNWQSFNIGESASVRFSQPSNSSAALNRVTASGNQITGTLVANNGGAITLNNSSGVIFNGEGITLNGAIATSTGSAVTSGNVFLGGSLSLSSRSGIFNTSASPTPSITLVSPPAAIHSNKATTTLTTSSGTINTRGTIQIVATGASPIGNAVGITGTAQ